MMNENNGQNGAMYTLNSKNSYYNNTKVALNVFLRPDDSENPYEITAFDISQADDKTQYNAIFINISNANFANEDPEQTTEHTYECLLSNLSAPGPIANYSAFDCNHEGDTLAIVLYNYTDDITLLKSYAIELAAMVKDLTDTVAKNGNYQTELNLMGIEPRRTGMSTFPRK
ncbi:MAG: hypothetical protein DI539_08890 [Flavobacterium psychrophilum]|nr:MAG: hypothetical protein DI539_08890 [Flavobacterium psychrophilum]